MNFDQFKIVSEVIRSRKTKKVLTTEAASEPQEVTRQADELLSECIATAGWAPFHYDRGMNGIREPWRFHILSKPACVELASELPDLASLKPESKLPQLLQGCSTLVLVTWIPQFGKNTEQNFKIDDDKMRQVNEEHLAATAAASQNLLLLAQSLKWDSYWASGGILGQETVLDRLGISCDERVLSAIFLRYSQMSSQHATIISGKHREHRSDSKLWCQRIHSLK